MQEAAVLIQHKALKEICNSLLQAVSINPKDAETTSDVTVCAELRGISSHGIARLPAYLKRIRTGLINARPEFKYYPKYGSVTVMDADNGLGQVAACKAMEKAIDIAGQTGAGLVGVRNSNHFGVAAYYAMQALPHDMIGIVLTNASPAMAPFGGRKAFLGTNPMAVAIPGQGDDSIVVDMASSITARGKIRLCAAQGVELPAGWALDEEGNPTTDPAKALQGSILPMGGAKGYALAVLIDLMAGMLTGGGYSVAVKQLNDYSGPVNAGHLLMAIKIEAFMEAETFKGSVSDYIARLHEAPRAGAVQKIYAPGEIEQNLTRERLEKGIPLTGEQVDLLEKMAAEYGVAISLDY
ncbi:MAG TPA: Ldh family oxidoreductase [Bacillota bacterium]|jgi:LDH2 family malate/lactate/ureidoglycolate dehydrogenase|nr:Ldh family oxidoreductase [Bacillota bacterium]HOA36299.1 Ldh family oxidoreductase [Bacillota bacterium]HPZ12372.1 Ldh family oxidoreductase [Bacillota bacterium]HQE10631.1 Ldh family oxidoreductase [Bacillota bacterium]